jgi:hypothetical protein
MGTFIVKIPDGEEKAFSKRIDVKWGVNRFCIEEFITNAIANFLTPNPERPYDSAIEVFRLI